MPPLLKEPPVLACEDCHLFEIPKGTWGFWRAGKRGQLKSQPFFWRASPPFGCLRISLLSKENHPNNCLHFYCSPVLSGLVEKLPLSSWQCCLMTVFHVQQTNELLFVCSHYALCTWHHLHVCNGVASGYVLFKLCLCENVGELMSCSKPTT